MPRGVEADLFFFQNLRNTLSRGDAAGRYCISLSNAKLSSLIAIIARSYISHDGISADRSVCTSRSGARDKSRALIICAHAKRECSRNYLPLDSAVEENSVESNIILIIGRSGGEASNRRGNSLYARERFFRFAAH